MEKKDKIFLGGSYSSDKEIRSRIAEYAKRIEKTIIECGFVHSLNLLSNPIVHSDKADESKVYFGNGKSFSEVGNKAISDISDSKIERLKALRYFEDIEIFKVCLKASSIAMAELKTSVAAIFELSEQSQGSYLEIGQMIYHFQKPVLALRNDKGRNFGTMLTGSQSALLITRTYNDQNLESIVKTFLLSDLKLRNMKSINLKLPVILQNELKKVAKKEGFKSTSDLVRFLSEQYIDKK